MNRLSLAKSSSVGYVVIDPGPASVYVLRCFLCDWGMTVGGSFKDCLDAGIEHEHEHGLAVARVRADLKQDPILKGRLVG